MDNLGGAVTGIAGLSVLVIVLFIAVQVALIALGVWITYTIIWRAVRRGLREFSASPRLRGMPPTDGPTYPPAAWTEPKQRGPRDW